MRNVKVVVPDLAGGGGSGYLTHRKINAARWFPIGSERSCCHPRRARIVRSRCHSMPYGVQYAWLIDPAKRMLEAYRLDAGVWVEVGRFAAVDQVVASPFEAVSIDLEGLWLPRRPRLVESSG